MPGEPRRAEDDEAYASTIIAAPAATAPGLDDATSLRSPLAQSVVAISGATTVRTAEEAMSFDETERTRIFLRVTIGIALAEGVPLPFIGGDRIAKLLLAAALGAVVLASAWFLNDLRDPARYREYKKTFVTSVAIAAAFAGIYFWGVFSPAPLILVFGIFFVGSHGRFTTTLGAYLACAVVDTLLVAGVCAGWIADRGMMKPQRIDVIDVVAAQTIVQIILLASYLYARSNRRTTLQAMNVLQQTVRVAAAREALLQEARLELARALQIGGPGRYTDQTFGSYVLGVVIGRGGMGEVYEAKHAATGDVAAVKVPHRHLLAEDQSIARFVREAKLASTLVSAHIVRVLEVGIVSEAMPFLAMERLKGEDLAQVLRHDRRMDAVEVADMVTQVASGIGVAHAAGIVHRDLKPQNVFLAESDRLPVWKILDFGVSKLADGGATLTRGAVLGTPSYMAPEQARGENVDSRADVYAVAAIAYRALTGRPPYSGLDVVAVLLEVVQKMPLRPRSVAGVTAAVEAVLMVGLAKDRDDRFANARELSEALARAARGEPDEALRARAAALQGKHPWSEEAPRSQRSGMA